MNCPVCNRENANSLSICPSCGAMSFDSVREELKDKITMLSKPIPKPEFGEPMKTNTNFIQELPSEKSPNEIRLSENTRGNFTVPKESNQNRIPSLPKVGSFEIESISKSAVVSETANVTRKNDNIRLVEFHAETAELPEWRLKVQNAARQRLNRYENRSLQAEPAAAMLVTSGANALKLDELNETQEVAEINIGEIENPTLARALKRIEQSRNQFYEEPEPKRKQHNLYIAAKESQILPKPEAVKARINEPIRPKKEKTLLKTKPESTSIIEPAKISSSFDKRPIIPAVLEPKIAETTLREETVVERNEVVAETLVESREITVEATNLEYARLINQETGKESAVVAQTEEVVGKIETKAIEIEETEQLEYEEFEDCAPFALRFNAGLFDLLIGSFLSLFLLAPFMLLGGNWFTLSGLFAFVATCSIVMFIYLTTAVGLFGRTFGMRMFSLEVIDIEGEAYPTLHQAAVSSSVYLLSLGLGGIGFLTLLTNPEKRAVHDLASGTIVIKEY